jgi:hypothetical protein
MARKAQKKRSPKPASGKGNQWLYVDPARVRFQHSRIRPSFSGCGRSVEETLESIRNKELAPSDLPPIQVGLHFNELHHLCWKLAHRGVLGVSNLISFFITTGDCGTGGS